MRHGKHWCRLCQGVSGYTLFRDNNSTNPSCKALYPFCLAEWTPKRRMRQGGTRLLSSVRPAKYKGRMALRKKLVLLVLLSRKGGEFIVSPKKSLSICCLKKKKKLVEKLYYVGSLMKTQRQLSCPLVPTHTALVISEQAIWYLLLVPITLCLLQAAICW